ncbi:MAG: type II toxin-antitoxin system HicB family antitoxin [Rhodocyclaceae bacterium]|nr:type II toxin-antitoxin system HicB family antitoxin [Rhodocyclaceae bacterium]
MEIRYPATIEQQEEGGFLVQFVDFDNIFTQGETLEEAQFNAAEVLSVMLEVMLEDGQKIAAPSQNVAGAHYIAPDAKTQAALLVRMARGERSLADLARALQTSWPAAKRLEDARHWPTLRALDRAAAALGKRLILSME